MIVDVADGWAVLWSSVAWAVASVLVGAWATRLPVDRLGEGPVTRLRRWEQGGRRWDRLLALRRWKDLVPEAGAWMGGASKRHVPSRRTEDLRRFSAETVRAERVHWLLATSTVVHAVWCPPAVLAGMAVFGIVANLPCVLIQRYNRGRLGRILDRRPSAGGVAAEADRPAAPADPPQHERGET